MTLFGFSRRNTGEFPDQPETAVNSDFILFDPVEMEDITCSLRTVLGVSDHDRKNPCIILSVSGRGIRLWLEFFSNLMKG